MRRKYYKSLDRPVNVFGLRGEWLKYFGIGCGADLVVAFLIGALMGTGVGMGLFIGLAAVVFFACLVLQAKYPSRRLGKVRLRQKMELRVVRRTALSKAVPRLKEKVQVES